MTSWQELDRVVPTIVGAVRDVMALPAPVDVLCAFLLLLLAAAAWVVVTPTVHVAELGPWFPPVYWLLVLWLLALGRAGAGVDARIFSHGEDLSAYAGSRASWLGFASKVTRLRVGVVARVAATRLLVGYCGAVGLLAVGLVWWWGVLLLVVWSAVRLWPQPERWWT